MGNKAWLNGMKRLSVMMTYNLAKRILPNCMSFSCFRGELDGSKGKSILEGGLRWRGRLIIS